MKLVIPWQILLFSRIDFGGRHLASSNCVSGAAFTVPVPTDLLWWASANKAMACSGDIHAALQEIPGTPIPTIFEWMEMVISNQKPHVKIWFIIQLIANH